MVKATETFDITALTGITQDSRAVKRGMLFAALPGQKSDGRLFIDAAIRNGAAALLVPPGTVLPDEAEGLAVIEDDNPRRRLAMLAAEFYDRQPETIVAVTGTNGKTSTVDFVKQLWVALGYQAASIGTLGMRAPGGSVKFASMTTPDAVSLHAGLADLAAAGVTHLAMEASSHGLDQYRLDGVKIGAAAFTNFSHDHLDYHRDMEGYFAAKTRLFAELMPRGAAVVLNADSPEFTKLCDIATARGLSVISYGRRGEQIRLLNSEARPASRTVELEVFGVRARVDLPLVGEFQAMNVLCALGLVLAGTARDKDSVQSVINQLPGLQGVPGRLQLVQGDLDRAAVYIDYAHTPDALETILTALRPHAAGRLLCLFGCGGDRDRGKRPVMGRIASALADHVIITDDNPRSEEPEVIRAAIAAGAGKNSENIAGRREAIRRAVAMLQPGDVLVIAGKGHEQGQIYADRTDPFDDYTEAQNAIRETRI